MPSVDDDPLERNPLEADPLDSLPLDVVPESETGTLPSVGAPARALAAASAPEPAPPAVIRGRYRVERALGAGGMGEVLLAEDLELRRRVAIKRVRADLSRDPELRRRIERECLLHAKVGAHAHIVTLFDRFEEDGRIHLVMEFVEGESLQSLLDRGRRSGSLLPIPEALTIVSQTLDALSRIHAAGLVHRDIKPDNVMVARDDSGAHLAKLMDFGIARVQDPGEGGTRLTQAGMGGPGTPRYMAPEQIDPSSFGELSAATDLYAIGIMLYEMVSGDAPFTGGIATVFMGHLMNEPPPLDLKPRSNVNARLEETIRRAIAKRPEERFPTARAFREEIDRLIAAGETRPHEGLTPLLVIPPPIPASAAHGTTDPFEAPTSRSPMPRPVADAVTAAARGAVTPSRGADVARSSGAPAHGRSGRGAFAFVGAAALLLATAGVWKLGAGDQEGGAVGGTIRGASGDAAEVGPMGRFEAPDAGAVLPAGSAGDPGVGEAGEIRIMPRGSTSAPSPSSTSSSGVSGGSTRPTLADWASTSGFEAAGDGAGSGAPAPSVSGTSMTAAASSETAPGASPDAASSVSIGPDGASAETRGETSGARADAPSASGSKIESSAEPASPSTASSLAGAPPVASPTSLPATPRPAATREAERPSELRPSDRSEVRPGRSGDGPPRRPPGHARKDDAARDAFSDVKARKK